MGYTLFGDEFFMAFVWDFLWQFYGLTTCCHRKPQKFENPKVFDFQYIPFESRLKCLSVLLMRAKKV